jgi:hypothetical protein
MPNVVPPERAPRRSRSASSCQTGRTTLPRTTWFRRRPNCQFPPVPARLAEPRYLAQPGSAAVRTASSRQFPPDWQNHVSRQTPSATSIPPKPEGYAARTSADQRIATAEARLAEEIQRRRDAEAKCDQARADREQADDATSQEIRQTQAAVDAEVREARDTAQRDISVVRDGAARQVADATVRAGQNEQAHQAEVAAIGQGVAGRVGAASTKSRRFSTAGWAGRGERDGKVYARNRLRYAS